MRNRWALVGIVVVVLALLACKKKSISAVVAEHRGPVTARFDAIKKLAPVVTSTAPLQSDGVQLGGQKVVLKGDAQNALFLHENDIPAPERTSSKRIGATFAGDLESCGKLLRDDFFGVASAAESYLKLCSTAKYLFVLRAQHDESGSMNGDGTFHAGRFDGDVLLFEIDGARLLGGFRVGVRSSDSLVVTQNDTDQSKLDNDISANLFVAVQKGLRQHVPGSVP